NAYYVGLDSVDVWLQNIGGLWSSYERVGYNNFRKQSGTANIIFRGIQSILPPGSQPDSETYATYTKLWNAILSAESDGRDIYRLSASEIASLDTSSVPVITYNTAMEMIISLSGLVS